LAGFLIPDDEHGDSAENCGRFLVSDKYNLSKKV
jgi:hypothetical protein